MARRIRLSMPAVDPILDRTEKGLVERALAALRRSRPRDSAVLWAQVKRVALLGVSLDEAPSLVVPASFGGARADEATLLGELVRLDPFGADVRLPEKAIVARGVVGGVEQRLDRLVGGGEACRQEERGEDDVPHDATIHPRACPRTRFLPARCSGPGVERLVGAPMDRFLRGP